MASNEKNLNLNVQEITYPILLNNLEIPTYSFSCILLIFPETVLNTDFMSRYTQDIHPPRIPLFRPNILYKCFKLIHNYMLYGDPMVAPVMSLLLKPAALSNNSIYLVTNYFKALLGDGHFL